MYTVEDFRVIFFLNVDYSILFLWNKTLHMKVLKQRKILKKITQWLTQERNMKLREIWDRVLLFIPL